MRREICKSAKRAAGARQLKVRQCSWGVAPKCADSASVRCRCCRQDIGRAGADQCSLCRRDSALLRVRQAEPTTSEPISERECLRRP